METFTGLNGKLSSSLKEIQTPLYLKKFNYKK